jgi:putative solute:sodium symporter small subunit
MARRRGADEELRCPADFEEPRMSDTTAESHRPPRPSVTDPATVARHREYWRRNIRIVGTLLAIWFVVSYGLGILLARPLAGVNLPLTGVPLGFWFAQQGSIYVFVVLIFVYVRLMNALDREFEVDEEGR